MVASRAISKNTTWIIVVDAWRLAYPLARPTAAARYIIARRQSYLSADSEPAQRVTRGLARFGRCESLSHLKITQRNCDFRNSSPSQVYIYCSARFLEPRNRKWFTTDSTAHFGSSSFSSPSVLKNCPLKVQFSSHNSSSFIRQCRVLYFGSDICDMSWPSLYSLHSTPPPIESPESPTFHERYISKLDRSQSARPLPARPLLCIKKASSAVSSVVLRLAFPPSLRPSLAG